MREVLLIGAAAERIAMELAGTVDLVPAGDLETAVRRAFSRARPDDVILLSPACSSFDQFQDYEERGRRFKQIVEGLAQEGQVASPAAYLAGRLPTAPKKGLSLKPGTGRGDVRDPETAPEPFQLLPPAMTAPLSAAPAQSSALLRPARP